MKVILMITHLERGGAQLVLLQIFKDLTQRGIDSVLISGRKEGPLVKDAEGIGPTIFVEELTNSFGLKTLWSDFKAVLKLIKILRKQKGCDKIIIHTHGSKMGLFGRIAGFIAGVDKIVHTIHGFSFNKYQNKLKQALFFGLEFITNLFTDSLIFVSQKDLEFAKKTRLALKPESILIRASANQNTNLQKSVSRKSSGLYDSGFLIGTVSCLKPQKNLHDLLRAFSLIKKNVRNAKLLIAGSGPEEKSLKDYTNQNAIKDVNFLGELEDLTEFYASIDVLAMSSLWEGLPCAVVEARFAKVPVVAYDTGGISEVISNGQNGFLIKQKNWEDLANKLIALAKNPSLKAQIALFEDKLDQFLPKTMCAEHLKLYKGLIKKN